MTYEEYLNQHGINQTSISEFGLTERNRKIVIPVKDSDGNFLFNKYRHLSGETKFTFDIGSHNQLFNIKDLQDNNEIFIVEGEPDCIRLHQEGLPAVSSTGGAMSFDKKWGELFSNKKVFICLDNDKAGKNGANRIAEILTDHASEIKIIKLPEGYKDICEFFIDQDKSSFAELIGESETYSKSNLTNDSDSNKLVFISFEEFSARNYVEPDWIVGDLIPENGLVAISGSPESCKSFFSLYVALSVATDTKILDRYTVKPTSVLVIDQENIQSRLKARIHQLSPNLSEATPFHLFEHKNSLIDLLDDNHFNQLKEYVQKKKIGLIIIDTLRLIHNNDENTSKDMKPVFARLKELTNYSAVLLIHHHRKSDMFGKKKSSAEEMMGSIFILGSLDSHLTLTRYISDENKTTIKVRHTKSRYTTPIKAFEMELTGDKTHLEFKYIGESKNELYKKEEAMQTICNLLEEQELTKNNFVDLIVKKGICSKRTLETALSELIKNKVIGHKSRPYVYFLIRESSDRNVATLYKDYEIANNENEI